MQISLTENIVVDPKRRWGSTQTVSITASKGPLFTNQFVSCKGIAIGSHCLSSIFPLVNLTFHKLTVAILVNPKETIRSAEENSDEIQGRAKKATLIAGKWEFPRLSSINTPLTHRCLNSVEADAADVLPSLQGFGYLRGVMDSNGQSFTESHRSSSPNHRRH